MHKGGLQCTDVNKYCLFRDQTQVSVACTQTFFYFSLFFSKTSASTRERAQSARKENNSTPPLPPYADGQ